MNLPIENVQEFPRPPIVEAVSQRVRIVHDGHTIADSVNALRVLETHHAPTYYIPKVDIQAELVAVPGTSFCEWKGRATYYDLIIGGKRIDRVGWTYEDPTQGFSDLRGHVAVYASKVDACFVGDTQVVPQPGDFYGGWQTPNLRGSIKGARGTEHW